jgi:GAF domain-containing protein
MDRENRNSKKLIKAIKNLISTEVPLVSNLANLSRILSEYFVNTCWCGFYICEDDKNEMYLGPFQGPVACTKIPYSKGVCGAAVSEKKSQLVPNVHEFPGHIACYSLSNSEVVVPIIKDNCICGVIDLDSTEYNNYTSEDVLILEEIASIISVLF